MQIRHIGLLLLFLLLTVFAIANWSVVTSPTDLNLLLGRVQAPFGLLMLVTVAVMGCVYAVMLLVGERSLLRENTQLALELSRVREQEPGPRPPELGQIRTVVADELSPVKELLTRTLADLERRDDEAGPELRGNESGPEPQDDEAG